MSELSWSARNVGCCRDRFQASRFVIPTLLALWALSVGASRVRAQANTADVVGTVTDVSGAVVPNATVTLTNTGTGIAQTLETSGSGDYDFTLVQVGAYNIKVAAKGFKTFSAPDFALSAGDRARIDAKLEIGESTQTVEVSGAVAPALQTDTSSLATLVTSQAVEDVPLNGRNITKLIQLSPGVQEGTTNGLLSGTRPDDRRAVSSFTANGQNESINNNMIDGLDNNERVIGGNEARPSVEFIQEVNLTTNNYDASLGKTGGATVDIVTKSGTNELHGSLFEFFRNKVLNTNPGYSFPANSKGGMTPVPPNPPFQQNQWGGSVGGPIKKNKTFFFADFEQFLQSYGLSGLAASTVPTLCNRGTTLAALQGYSGAITCPDGTNPTLPGDFSDTPTISQPGGSPSPCTSSTYNTSSCPYVTIPSGSIAPLGLAYFSMYPVPNCAPLTSTCNSYTTPSAIRKQHLESIDGRIDQHFSDTNTLYARYNINDSVTQIPPSFPNVTLNPATGYPEPASTSGGVTVNPGAPGFGGVNGFPGFNYTRGQQLAISFVHVIDPSLVLNLKAAFTRLSIRSLPINQGTNASNKLGFQCTATPNALSSGGNCINGPGLAFATALAIVTPASPYQVLGDSPFVPLLEFDSTFQYAGQLVWNKGSHSIKVGVSVIRRRAAIGQSPSPNGAFSFTGNYTGEPLGDLLEGLVDGGVSEGGQPAALRSYTLWEGGYEFWEPTAYIQDDWRAKHWLTLNLGMRYDVFTPFVERRDRITNYDMATGLIVGPGIPGAQQSGRTAGLITPYLDIAPRFGFAATLRHDLVIRGGAGLTFFPINYSSNYSLKNAPGNYNANCLLQNETGTNTVCQAPFASGAVAQYGNPVCVGSPGAPASAKCPAGQIPNAASPVGQTGGSLLAAGAPVPITNVNLVFAPSPTQCWVDPKPLSDSTRLPYSQTCPAATDPYQSYSINSAQPFNALNEYLEQANLNVEKAFGSNVLTVGVVSELGRHVPVSNFNLQSLSNPFEQGVLPLTNEFPWLGKTSSILEYAVWGASSYNALQASFVRRFSKGLTASLNYTWAQGLQFTSVPCTPTQTAAAVNQTPNGPVNVPAAINPCYFDNPASPTNPIIIGYWNKGGFNDGNISNARDRISYTTNYLLPFGKSATGVEKAFVTGWALNVAGSWSTGLPFTVGQTDNTTGLGSAGNPDQICSGKISNPTHLQWFNAGCFAHQSAINTFGNEHFGQLFGPHLQRVDFSFFKEFSVNERFRLQFRTEVFNLFNHPNFNNPTSTISLFAGNTTGTAALGQRGLNTNANLSSPPVGAITSLNSNFNSRQIQFALKLLF